MYNKLFEKGQIGSVRIKNRTVMTSMTLGYPHTNGEASDTLIRHYEERAKGGVGLIMTEIFRVNDEHGRALLRQVSLTGPGCVKSLSEMTAAVHKYGTKIFAQLHHGGNQNSPLLNNGAVYSASDVPAFGGAVPVPLTTEQTEELTAQFIRSAVLCRTAGFDGVLLHGAHGYLIAQFMTPYFNKRTDKYGGSFENRMRFPADIIRGIKAACGKDFAVGIRINGDDLAADKLEGTLELKDGVMIAKAMQEAGADVIDVSVGAYFTGNYAIEPYSYREGWRKHITKAIKDAVDIPVIGTNTIKTPEFAEQLLREGVSDFAGLGRSLLSDPEWTKKAREGREEEIRKCLGCLYCFESLIASGSSGCSVNPKLGREALFDNIEKNGGGRPVVVIGGGPAGLQAAAVLAERGYDTTLFEKSERLGGMLNTADKVAEYKDKITKLTQTLILQAELAGVKFRLGEEAVPGSVSELNPEGVFIAAGSLPLKPNVPGIDKENVYYAADILDGKVKISGSAVIIGSGLTGLETAEKLQSTDVKVTVAEMAEEIGPQIYPMLKMDIMERLMQKGLEVYPGHMLTAVTDTGVKVTELKTGEEKEITAHSVVIAAGTRPNTDLLKAFDDVFERVTVIGDAVRVAKIHEALSDGLISAAGF